VSADPFPEPSQPLPRQALTYWRVQSVLGAVFVAAMLGSTVGGLWPLVGFVVGVVLGIVGPTVLWRRWRYEIREEEIDLRHGLFTTRRTLVPIRRVQHVDTESGPLQGLFELSTVSVHTAAGATKIPGLLRGQAEEVRRRVADLTRTRDDT
jgi:uncharacterized protein